MIQTKKIYAAEAVLVAVSILALTGCAKKAEESRHTEIAEAQYDMPQVQTVANGSKEQDEAQEGAVEEKQGEEIKVIEIRSYSDNEKERMEELQSSYQDETTKPEKMIREVDSVDDVTEGTLCYIVSTGQYYLPDRELTDEELLEIIDCNFRIALNSNHKTQEEWDEIDRKERAEFEARVKAAGGISEDEAIEIAQKAMETDLGEGAKELSRYGMENNKFGWKLRLEVADWSEIKEEDRGAIVYSVGFNNVEKVSYLEDLDNYVCVVNAVDGRILEAYSLHGIHSAPVYYDH